jgi:hypothetical protein
MEMKRSWKITLNAMLAALILVPYGCNRTTGGGSGDMELESFQVIEGDGTIYLQWSIAEDGNMAGREIEGLYVHKVGSGTIGAINLYQEEGLIMPEYGTFLDTVCVNGVEYGYFLEAVLNVELSLHSDTIYGKVQHGLPDPFPVSPDSVVSYCEDSFFVLQWIPPVNHDSLYYLCRSDNAQSWFTFSFEPIWYNTPQCTLPYTNENDYRYFKIACFINGIMSLPSDSVIIVKPLK